MKRDSLISDFTSGNVFKQLIQFATPLFLSSLLQFVYNLADMIIVGRVAGQIGMSGVSVGGEVVSLLTMISIGFCNAGQVIISQFIGAGRKDKVSRFVPTMYTSLFIFAIISSILCIICRRPLLRIMNTPETAFQEALNYSTICLSGLVFIYGYNISASVLRGLGDSRHPFIFIAISCILNVILDIVFVYYLKMGAAGAATATVIAQAISFISSTIFFAKNQDRSGIKFTIHEFLHIDKEMLMNLIKLGVPMAIKNSAVHMSKMFINSWINSYGVTVSAFAGIVSKLDNMANVIQNSFNAAASSMVGQNIGSKRYNRVGSILLSTFCIVMAIMLVFVAIIALFPEKVFGVFTTEPEVILIGLDYVYIACLTFIGAATRGPVHALINGSGNSKFNFLVAIIDGVVARVSLGLILGLACKMDYMGFWLGDALAGYVPLILGLIFYFSGSWKKSDVRI